MKNIKYHNNVKIGDLLQGEEIYIIDCFKDFIGFSVIFNKVIDGVVVSDERYLSWWIERMLYPGFYKVNYSKGNKELIFMSRKAEAVSE